MAGAIATSHLVHSLCLPRPTTKSGHGLGLGELPKIFGLPYNISATAEASDFKFDAPLGFAKDNHKNTRRRKGAWPWAGELPNIWRFNCNIYTMAEDRDFKFGILLGFEKPTIKPHPEKKWA